MDTNILLEVYEYILNEYPRSPNNADGVDDIRTHFYTTKIESIDPHICGYISDEGSAYTKKPISDQKIRSCDVIDGTIKNMVDSGTGSEIASSNKTELIIDDERNTIWFELDGITSIDLIKFSHEFVTKIKTKSPETIQIVQSNITNMAKLYDVSYIRTIFSSVTTILKKDWGTYKPHLLTYIKKLIPTKKDKFIVLGDLHGSFATFMRILLRFRKLNYMDEKCILKEDYHIIFLGDIIDRGTYGYEVMLLIFLLKITNPNNVHINNGNHEEKRDNDSFNFRQQLISLFSIMSDSATRESWGDEIDIGTEIWEDFNKIFVYNHSALLIKNPNMENKHIYLAHGGYPITPDNKLHPLFEYDNIMLSDKIFIPNAEINCPSNSVRWNDFYGLEHTTESVIRGAWNIGCDCIDYVTQELGIELTIRAHQDSINNTKLLLRGVEEMHNINEISPFNPETPNPLVCYGFSHLIESFYDLIYVNKLQISNVLPVITISTNTDQGRDLVRDSYVILKFENNYDPQIQGCVQQDTEDEETIKKNILRLLIDREIEDFPEAKTDDRKVGGDTLKDIGYSERKSDYVWQKKYLKYKNKYLNLKKQLRI